MKRRPEDPREGDYIWKRQNLDGANEDKGSRQKSEVSSLWKRDRERNKETEVQKIKRKEEFESENPLLL